MLKGSIETLTKDSISGWAYSPAFSLRGALVMAFVGDECVGSGAIEYFRQDLADAGLGDGFLGFQFDLRVSLSTDLERIFVRIADSDAVLMRQEALLKGTKEGKKQIATCLPNNVLLSAVSLQWMLSRGWLSQVDHDFLKFFERMGVYDRALRPPRTLDEVGDLGKQDPHNIARELFSLWAMRDVEPVKQQLRQVDDFATYIKKLVSDKEGVPIYALWSAERLKIGVFEGSHAADMDEHPAEVPYIDYTLGPDRMLILHAQTLIRKLTTLPQGGIVILTGKLVT